MNTTAKNSSRFLSTQNLSDKLIAMIVELFLAADIAASASAKGDSVIWTIDECPAAQSLTDDDGTAHTLTTLVSFTNTNGATPSGTLLLDSQHNLIGTTAYGGASGDGTIFEVPATASSTIRTLATFTGGRPVKMVFSREEELSASQTRHATYMRLKTGVKKDGTDGQG